MNSVDDLARQGRSLSPADRVRLLDLLLESLEENPSGELDVELRREIERRVGAHERGDGELFDAADVMADVSKIAP